VSIIPLDLQRRFEQRWAARLGQKPPNAPKTYPLERQGWTPAPPKGKRKTDRLNSRGVGTAPAV
jgi:hypothetical protein